MCSSHSSFELFLITKSGRAWSSVYQRNIMGYLQASMVDGIFGMLLITISSNVKASFSLLNVTPTTNKCSKHDIVDIGLYHIAIYFIY